jgi:hypothetical protein
VLESPGPCWCTTGAVRSAGTSPSSVSCAVASAACASGLADGAVLIDGERLFHGAEAIQWLAARMEPSAALLRLLAALMKEPPQARRLYPLLLAARRTALGLQGLPLDPDHAAVRAAQSEARAEGTGRGR